MTSNEITLLWFVLNFSAPSQDKINCNSWRGISVKQFSFLLSANNKNISNIWLKKKERNNLGFIFFCLLWAVLCYKHTWNKEERTGVNFINIFCTRILYERCFGSFILVTFGLAPKFCTKKRVKNVDEIDGRRNNE